MTSNPPPLPVVQARSGTAFGPAPDVRTALEEWFVPAWLNDDPASEGPNYLGYTMLLLPVFLVAMLALFAIAIL